MEPFLNYPKFTKPSVVTTDALVAILVKEIAKDALPIAYTSQQMNNAKQKYSTTEQECLHKWIFGGGAIGAIAPPPKPSTSSKEKELKYQ